ncbi:hypothetical protein DBR11_11445 [Pedobacter sp. HMWF019]|uniref:hypothetical protein n=1 Tax=Pedobacter sp. HMWF019 TaxID=2056856 RepID=UPI000D347EFC|nr:hypothetical protein [Pedobacter sp. HMWF019]PTS99880.1 hypothetical protein DBR11_11445 [Pedobacter sp. HMWF019]
MPVIDDQVILYNTLFEVDRPRKRFVESGNRLNSIPFSTFKQEGDKMVIDIDPDSRSAYKPKIDNPLLHAFMKKVKVPKSVFENEIGGNEKLIQEINQKSFEEKSNFQILNSASRFRINGKRPIVSIEGEPFKFHHEKQLLIHLIDDSITISTKYMTEVNDLKSLQFIYNKKTKRSEEFLNKNEPIPDHLVLIRIPNPLRLDPVGEALKWDKPAHDFLAQFPYKDNVVAKVVPWKNFWIKEKMMIGEQKKPQSTKITRSKKKEMASGS